MSFRFRKLYADLVTPDGSVTIVYLSCLELWGVRTAFAGVELYSCRGRRRVLRAQGPVRLPDPDTVRGNWSLQVAFPGTSLELSYGDALAPWAPAGPPPHGALDWRVLIPRATARARWSRGLAHQDVAGRGYVDWVELRSPPRRLDLESLTWGRAHLPEAAIVFTAVRFRSGHEWNRAARWPDGGDPQQDSVRVGVDGGSIQAAPGPDGDPSPYGVTLADSRILHKGPGIDVTRFPGWMERSVSRICSGALHETRWVSRVAGQEGKEPDPEYRMVHELVRFGGAP